MEKEQACYRLDRIRLPKTGHGIPAYEPAAQVVRSVQCWGCGLWFCLHEDLAYHLMANSACAYDYRADGRLLAGIYGGTAYTRKLRKGDEPWLVEALLPSLDIGAVARFASEQEAAAFAKHLNGRST